MAPLIARRPETGGFDTALIAPCGMNCGICAAHLRGKKPCPGCNGPDTHKPARCINCAIRHCKDLRSDLGSSGTAFCGRTAACPCDLLKRLDSRYRKKYGMSMVENLERVGREGLSSFVESEASRWRCVRCGGVVCVHDGLCSRCGAPREAPAEKHGKGGNK